MNDASITQNNYQWRSVRVFISGTRRDMYAEREYLTHYVAVKLRDWCLQWKLLLDVEQFFWQHDNLFQLVNLVRGHRQELSIVLFLAGSRYSKVTRYTRMALDELQRTTHLFFYLREPASLPGVEELEDWSEQQRSEYRQAFIAEQWKSKGGQLLSTLIREKEKQPFCYRANFDVDLYNSEDENLRGRFTLASMEELGDRVLDDAKSAINSNFQKRMASLWQQRDTWQAQRNIHESWLERYSSGVGRSLLLEKMWHYTCDESSEILAVYGEKGIGKTTLLAKFCKEYQKRQTRGDIIPYFIGASPASDYLPNLLRTLKQELKRRYAIGNVQGLPQILQAIRRKVILVIDGLDYLDPARQAHELYWLPGVLPARVKIIVSTGDGCVRENLQSKTKRQLIVGSLSEKEMQELIPQLVKMDSYRYYDVLQRCLPVHNPRYLQLAVRTLLSSREKLVAKMAEIRVVNRSKSIEKMLGHYFLELPEGLSKFLSHQLEVLQRRFAREYPYLVSTICGLLAHSRHGLTEHELRELLLEVDEDNAHRIVLHQLQPYLTPAGKPMRLLYAPESYTNKTSMQWHQMLAYYFQGHPLPRNFSVARQVWNDVSYRKLREQPWQQSRGRMWEELLCTLTDIEFLEAKVQSGLLLELHQDFIEAAQRLPRNVSCEVAPGVVVDVRVISLLEKILCMELQFLHNHPQCLFQTLWNYGYWHDAPEAKKQQRKYHSEKTCKLYLLMEHWRRQKEQKKQFVWLKSHHPLRDNLDTTLRKILRSPKPPTGRVCFSGDGSKIIATSQDKTVLMWSPHSGEVIHVLTRTEEAIIDNYFSYDGSKVASQIASWGSKKVKIWNSHSDKAICTIEAQEGVRNICFSPRGDKIALGYSRRVEVWDVDGACLIYEFSEAKPLLRKTHFDIRSPNFDPTGEKIVYGVGHTVRIFSRTQQERRFFTGHKGLVLTSCFSPCGELIASGGQDNVVKVWEAKGKLIHTLSGHERRVIHVHFSPDGSRIISECSREIRIWSTDNGELLHTIEKQKNWMTRMGLSCNGQEFVLGSNDGAVRVWEIRQNQEIFSPAGNIEIIKGISCNSHAKKVVAIFDKKMQIWDATSGRQLREITKQDGHIAYISLDGSKIAAIINYHQIWVWNTNSGQLLHRLSENNYYSSVRKCLCFSDSGQKIACGANEEVEIWDIRHTGRLIHSLRGHREAVLSVCFSMGSDKIVSGSKDKTVRIWDVATEKSLHALVGHEGAVTDVWFSPDGKHIFSADNRTVRQWDAETGSCIHVRYDEKSAITAKAGKVLYEIIGRGHRAVVHTRADRQPIAFFPGAIREAQVFTKNLMAGYIADYVYILELRGGK